MPKNEAVLEKLDKHKRTDIFVRKSTPNYVKGVKVHRTADAVASSPGSFTRKETSSSVISSCTVEILVTDE